MSYTIYKLYIISYHIIYHISYIVYHISYIIYHISCIIYHISYIYIYDNYRFSWGNLSKWEEHFPWCFFRGVALKMQAYSSYTLKTRM
jgi:hypothetical protein